MRNQNIDRTTVDETSDESFVVFLDEFMDSFRTYREDLVTLTPPEQFLDTRDDMVVAIDVLLDADMSLRDQIATGERTDEALQARIELFEASQSAFIEVERLCRVMERETDRIDGLSCPWIVEAGQPTPE